ncbi:MAG: hypothetical protein M3N45_05160 [Actinomycetota bacterium]|nr:hypothetical protein [Actinomycetota bacterium]
MKETIFAGRRASRVRCASLAQTVGAPRIAEEELVPWTSEAGYVMHRYQRQVAGQYSTEPLLGYVSWDEYCWYDPDNAYVIGADSNIPVLITPCGMVS